MILMDFIKMFQQLDSCVLWETGRCAGRKQSRYGTCTSYKWNSSTKFCWKIQFTVYWDQRLNGTQCEASFWYTAGVCNGPVSKFKNASFSILNWHSHMHSKQSYCLRMVFSTLFNRCHTLFFHWTQCLC